MSIALESPRDLQIPERGDLQCGEVGPVEHLTEKGNDPLKQMVDDLGA